jgi:hypothetical protein
MNAVAAVGLLSEMLRQAMAISQLIQRAQAENRDLTATELAAIAGRDDTARQALVAAIAAADAKAG